MFCFASSALLRLLCFFLLHFKLYSCCWRDHKNIFWLRVQGTLATLLLCPQTPLPPAAGASPTPVILHCKLFSLDLPKHTDTSAIHKNTLCSWNYSGSAPGFRRRKKKMLHFVCYELRKLYQ